MNDTGKILTEICLYHVNQDSHLPLDNNVAILNGGTQQAADTMSLRRSPGGTSGDADGIPTRQLERWTNSGARTQPRKAQQRIRRHLAVDRSPVSGRIDELDIFIQGSHKNDTITYGGGDVDLVVKLESAYYTGFERDMPDWQVDLYGEQHTSADYDDSNLRDDTCRALNTAGISYDNGRKAIEIDDDDDRLGFGADIVPCCEFRLYRRYEGTDESEQEYTSGIAFKTNKWWNNRVVVNFPKQHYQRGTEKNSRANGRYKETVRLFKNARDAAVERGLIRKKQAPSYFVECLLSNVPDGLFDQPVAERYPAIVQWLCDSHDRWDSFESQNKILPLFDNQEPDLWTQSDALDFVTALTTLWNDWKTL